MRVLIIGGEGQLGNSLSKKSAQKEFASFETTTLDQLDLSNENNLKEFLSNKKYNLIVNCTAYTAVDKAESEPEKAHIINALAAGWIGKYSKEMNARVIHVSTDYVFDGNSCLPLTPEMNPNPVSVYGKTKLEGEQLLMAENPNSIVIRTSWLYSVYGNNFMKTMLRLGLEKPGLTVVFDQIGTPTSANDLADAILSIIEQSINNHDSFKPGIYHFSNEGVCSWYDFAQMIFRLRSIHCNVKPVRSDAFPTVAKRPAYSVLDSSKISNQFGLEIPFWVNSLEECLKEMDACN
jgi:dTDP-4-dehydrorhamnose reductase